MEREIENKIFMLNEYLDKDDMEEHIKKYIALLKNKYPGAIITRVFYKGSNILVRTTKIENNTIISKQNNKKRKR